MDIDKRRAIFEAVRDRAHGLGLKFEDDPEFLGAVEGWISGKLDAAEFREIYLSILEQRERARRVEQFVSG
jgi:hypothetical protein